jgi:hypothetical protein
MMLEDWSIVGSSCDRCVVVFLFMCLLDPTRRFLDRVNDGGYQVRSMLRRLGEVLTDYVVSAKRVRDGRAIV